MLPLVQDLNANYGRGFTLEECDKIPEVSAQGRIGMEGACGSLPKLPEEFLNESLKAIRSVYGATPWSITMQEMGRFALKKAVDNLTRDELLVVGLWGIALLGVSIRAFVARESAMRRLLALLEVSGVFFQVAYALMPKLYFPSRYLDPVAPLFVLFLVSAAKGLGDWLGSRMSRLRSGWSAPVLILGLTISTLLLMARPVRRMERCASNASSLSLCIDSWSRFPRRHGLPVGRRGSWKIFHWWRGESISWHTRITVAGPRQ